ncbi:hypothetical protein TNCT_18611, partial [Trichonephila clavata]
MVVVKDLPASNFEMKLNLVKLQPRRMDVPCIQNIGSWYSNYVIQRGLK